MREILEVNYYDDVKTYIIWCNTVDQLFGNMFESKESARLYLEYYYESKKFRDYFSNFQGIVSKEDIEEGIKLFSLN